MARPLVVVTRGETSDDPLAGALRRGGAEVRWLPTTAVLPPLDVAPLDRVLARLADVDWVAFTSGHAVEAVAGRPAWASRRTDAGRPRIAAVGERTALLLAGAGARADVVASSPGAGGLARALLAAEGGSLAGRRVFWPRSDIARRELAEALASAGAVVVEAVAYRTVLTPPDGVASFRAGLHAGEIDAVCFLSPSAAEGLAAALGPEPRAGALDPLAPLRGRCLVASLGPATTETLARLGAPPDVEPPRASALALAAALFARLSVPQGASR